MIDDLQRADRLDTAISSLRNAGRSPADHRPRGGDRVDSVGLAVQTAGLAIGSVDLDHLNTSITKVTGETGAPTAGRLDTDPVDNSVARHPSQQLAIASGGRRERCSVDSSTRCCVAHRGHMHIVVGVDPARDTTGQRCHHDDRSFQFLSAQTGDGWEGHAQLGQDSQGSATTGSYEVTCQARPSRWWFRMKGRQFTVKTRRSVTPRVKPNNGTTIWILPQTTASRRQSHNGCHTLTATSPRSFAKTGKSPTLHWYRSR